MKGKSDPLKHTYNKGGMHSNGIPRRFEEPTEAQKTAVERLCEKSGLEPPVNYTKKAYSQFLSNHIKKR